MVSVIRKGGHRERVVLPPRSAIAVDDLLAERVSLEPTVRPNRGRRRHRPRRLGRPTCRPPAGPRGGVAHPIWPHSLRPTFVTSALAAGGNNLFSR